VINKGAGHYLGWYKNLSMRQKEYQFSYSPEGSTNDKLALEWLEKVFLPEVGVKCGARLVLLIFAGHGSHITYEFISRCLQSNVFLLLPAHSTPSHLLQPLDVGLFSPYQHFYGRAVDYYVRSGQNIVGIKNALFIPFLTEARNSTFFTQSITQSFLATGIHPLNPRRVLEKLNPPNPKKRDTYGIVKKPQTSRKIRQHVLATGMLLEGMSLDDQESIVGHVK